MIHIQTRIALLFTSLLFIAGCAITSDPEKSGGEVIAVPEVSGCQFSLSPDGKWLQYPGESSPWFESSEDNRHTRQRQAHFVNLETGDLHTPEPQQDVIEHIRNGYGPDGTGCFSPDSRTVYITKSIWGDHTSPQARADADDTGDQPRAAMAQPSRQVERYHYAVDLTVSPFTIVPVSSVDCADPEEPIILPITIRQPSDKRIEIYSDRGDLLASHKPRGLLSSRIHMDEPGSHHWNRNNALSPDGTRLAYQVGESGMMFASPTQGHVINLTPDADNSPKFLAASVYTFQWSSSGELFACTSHSKHRRAIVRWEF